MSSTVDRGDLIAALRLRYDAHSAETIFAAALARAGLVDQAAYSATDIASWRGALRKVGDRLANVDIRLDALLENLAGTPAPAPAAAPAPPPPKAAKADVPKADAPRSEPAKPEASKGDAPKADAPKGAAKSEAAKGDAARSTTVKLVGVKLADGEKVLVCGSFADWKIERAIAMKRAGDAWEATIPLAPDPSVVFKFVRSAADGALTWEGGKDRKLSAPAIEATWQPEEPTS
jgi:starch binding protein with CBM20 domain